MTTRITRRQLVQRGAAGVTILSLPGLLAACGGSGGGGGEDALKDVLKFSNWPLYIDVDEKTKKHPTLDAFTKKTGIKVDYFEDINDNATFFAKIQGPLTQGRGIDRDIIVMTDSSRFPALLIERAGSRSSTRSDPELLEPDPGTAESTVRPKREYSLPWQSGMTGIAWNSAVTGSRHVDRPAARRPQAEGQGDDAVGVLRLRRPRHALQRRQPLEGRPRSMDRALARIKKGSDSGQIRQFTGNDYAQPLTKGDIAAAVAWSGDVVQLHADNPKLKWDLPKDGGMIWTDNMLIPKGGSVATASTYMDFVYDPKIAAQIAAYVNYVTPVSGAKEALAKTDPETAKNPLIFPTDEMLAQVHQFDSEALQNDDYQAKWQKVLGA